MSAKLKDAQRQALKRLWRLSGERWWTSNEQFFNANAANALAAKGLFERKAGVAGPSYRITVAGRTIGDELFSARQHTEQSKDYTE